MLGLVLVVDELDKAPGEALAVLRSLVADGILRLPDGRSLRVGDGIHPEFRMVFYLFIV